MCKHPDNKKVTCLVLNNKLKNLYFAKNLYFVFKCIFKKLIDLCCLELSHTEQNV